MSAPLSVLLLVEQLRRPVPGGIGTYAKGLINGLSEIDRNDRPAVTLLASKSQDSVDSLRSFSVPLVTSQFSSRLATQLWDRNVVRIRRPESVVHAVSFGAPSTSAPLVMTVHDLAWRSVPEAFPPHGRRWHEAALRHAKKRAAHFIVPSTSVRDALCAPQNGISESRVSVIAEGADHLPDPDEVGLQHLLRELGVRDQFLLATGTLEPRKNLSRLIEAYGAMRPSLPEPWPLVVVGPQGWGTGTKEQDGVLFAGQVTPAVLAGLYRAARLVAYVPLLEGYGLPVVEAMFAGTPVVSSNVPSAGNATQLVNPLQVDDIAEGLRVVATSEARRAELRALGQVHVAPLTWRSAAEAHVKVWRGVVDEGQ